MKKAKNISGMDQEKFAARIAQMDALLELYKKQNEEIHVYISEGNAKTGTIRSVSTMPVHCCPNCSACKRLCYDVRNDCVYPNVQDTRARNTAIWETDPERYFKEITEAVVKSAEEAFRWHIGGDIVNRRYLEGMIAVAKATPECLHLAFTKMYNLINEYLDEGNELPENLQVIFSAWPGMEMDNRYNFPTSNPLFANGVTTAHEGAKWCPGNCADCVSQKHGCFYLKKGEEVIFPAH